MNVDVLNLGKAQFRAAAGIDEMKRDGDGFIVLTPTAAHVDKKVDTLTSSIGDLESKLKKFKEEKQKAEKYKKTEEYKTSKKKGKTKKEKKQKTALLEMVFNNADHAEDNADDADEEDEGYRDSKKPRKKKETATTLETTYGKRFTPIVSMLHDMITEFDHLAGDIQAELDSPQLRAKNMYRSTQVGNLISAKDKKFSAIKELASVATTISNLEYKKEKDKAAEEGSNTSKEISSLGAKFLRGGFDDYGSKKIKNGKGKKKKYDYSEDDDDDEIGSISSTSGKSGKTSDDDRELAGEFAKALMKHKDDLHFSDAEKAIKMEGKYYLKVVVDPTDPDNTWKFVACDMKTGKILEGFKDKYKGLIPKRKNCRMVFDLGKMKCTEKNSARTYKLMFDE